MSWQCVLEAKVANTALGCVRKIAASRLRKMDFPLD